MYNLSGTMTSEKSICRVELTSYNVNKVPTDPNLLVVKKDGLRYIRT
jgi:hypothetical protein